MTKRGSTKMSKLDGEDRQVGIEVVEKPIIIVEFMSGKSYYEIMYKEVGKSEYNVGFGSYKLEYVKEWLDTQFTIVENAEEKVVQFPVDMDEMQKNIMVELLNARKECTDENLLTARGCAAIIDALFYMVKSFGLPMKYVEDGNGKYFVGVDMGVPGGDKTGGLT